MTYWRVPTSGPSKENGQFMLKRCKFPDGFQGRVFKGKVRDRVIGGSAFGYLSDWLVVR